MSSPDIGPAEVEAVLKVLQSPNLSLGPTLRQFEDRFAEYVGVRNAIGVSSGTAALHLAVCTADLAPGDLVITSPFSFVASANCLLYEDVIPVLVDVDPVSGNLDPAQVRQAAADLAAGGETARRWLPRSIGAHGPLKGILPIHAFGQPADMAPLLDVAQAHGLALIEDACEAIGAEYDGCHTGTFGDAACFAFYPNKQMTTAEGGMIVTNDDTRANLLRSLRNQGRDVFDSWLSHTRLGYNYRLNELSCALGLVQLGRVDELLRNRERVAGWYNDRLWATKRIQPPVVVPTTSRMSWFVYVVRLESRAQRQAVMSGLADRGIPSRPYFTPIHLQPFYVERFGYRRGDFPVTERLGDTCLALPFSGVMTEEQVDHVCRELVAVLDAISLTV